MRQRKVVLTFKDDKAVHYFILVGNGESVLNLLGEILQNQKKSNSFVENDEIHL
jgi:hypothetical protein